MLSWLVMCEGVGSPTRWWGVLKGKDSPAAFIFWGPGGGWRGRAKIINEQLFALVSLALLSFLNSSSINLLISSSPAWSNSPSLFPPTYIWASSSPSLGMGRTSSHQLPSVSFPLFSWPLLCSCSLTLSHCLTLSHFHCVCVLHNNKVAQVTWLKSPFPPCLFSWKLEASDSKSVIQGLW